MNYYNKLPMWLHVGSELGIKFRSCSRQGLLNKRGSFTSNSYKSGSKLGHNGSAPGSYSGQFLESRTGKNKK